MRFKIIIALLPFLFATSLAAQPVFDENYERVLLPVFTPLMHGAFGSQFLTKLTVGNRSRTETLHIYGLEPQCTAPVTCLNPPDQFVEVPPFGEGPSLEPPALVPNGIPGRFIFVPKAEADHVAMNLRAFDLSRGHVNYGTQMPVVRERDFMQGRVVLPDVPMSSQFRKTLRIYSTRQTAVLISFEGPEFIGSPTILPPPPESFLLRPGMNVFDPSYGEFSNFAQYGANLTVVVEALECICSPPVPTPPIWAFITVTNNDTQHITTIAPN